MEKPSLIPADCYQYILCGIGALLLWTFIIEWVLLTLLIGAVYCGYIYYYQSKNTAPIPFKGKAVYITGCDSGFGFDLALLLNDHGFKVFAGCLNPDGEGAKELKQRTANQIDIMNLDITNDEHIQNSVELVKTVCQEKDLLLWAVINNAGVNFVGPIELIGMSEYLRICDVNIFGAVRVTKALLPLIRQSKGRIVNISSERGVVYRAQSSAYCMSKAGLENFSDSLRFEMDRFGVKVSIVEPGDFGTATEILNSKVTQHNKQHIDSELLNGTDGVKAAYTQFEIDDLFRGLEKEQASVISYHNTQPVIQCIAQSLVNPCPKERYVVGGTSGLYDPRTVCIRLKPILPDWLMDMVIQHYWG